MVEMVKMAHPARQAEMAYQARLVRMERMAGMVKTERLEKQGSLASEAHVAILAQAVEGWSTLTGDDQPAPTHLEQSWFMLEWLEELVIIRKEELPTTSVCQRTRTICCTRLGCRVPVQSVELSTRPIQARWDLFKNMTHLVRCVLPQPG